MLATEFESAHSVRLGHGPLPVGLRQQKEWAGADLNSRVESETALLQSAGITTTRPAHKIGGQTNRTPWFYPRTVFKTGSVP